MFGEDTTKQAIQPACPLRAVRRQELLIRERAVLEYGKDGRLLPWKGTCDYRSPEAWLSYPLTRLYPAPRCRVQKLICFRHTLLRVSLFPPRTQPPSTKFPPDAETSTHHQQVRRNVVVRQLVRNRAGGGRAAMFVPTATKIGSVHCFLFYAVVAWRIFEK